MVNVMIIQEADYKSLRKINNDNYRYGLKFDIANDIIRDIADNIYNLKNKLEGLDKLFQNTDIFISYDINTIINELDNLFNSDNWNNIVDTIENAE